MPGRRKPLRFLPADTPAIVEVWRRYRRSRRRADADRLARHYLPLLRFHARRVQRTAGARVDLDDLIGAGHVALVEAIEQFVPGLGGDFSAYSWDRLRRAIWGGLPALTGQPESARRKRKLASRHRRELTQELCRPPAPQELVERVASSGEWEGRRYGAPESAVAAVAVAAPVPLSSSHADRSSRAPFDRLIAREQRDAWRRRMSPLEWAIFKGFFFDGLQLRVVAARVGRNRSRVSKIFHALIDRLRADKRLARRLGVERIDEAAATFRPHQNRAA